jgi:hypothetical protein
MAALTALDAVDGKIVDDHDIAGIERGREHLLDIGEGKHSPSIGPSRTKGAVMPVRRRPAVKVVVFQWPCGTAARHRSPRGLRP